MSGAVKYGSKGGCSFLLSLSSPLTKGVDETEKEKERGEEGGREGGRGREEGRGRER